MKKAPAFTLLELLVAATAFTVVVVLATAGLSTTTNLQKNSKRSQLVNAQVNRILDELNEEVSATPNGLEVVHLGSTNDWTGSKNFYPNDDLLIVRIGKRLIDGSYDNSVLETHVYCAELQLPSGASSSFSGKRLARYIIPGTPGVQAVASKACKPDLLAGLFGQASAPASFYLTEAELEVVGFRVWPVWIGSPIAGKYYDNDAPAVRIEVSARYNQGNTGNNDSYRVSEDVEKNNSSSPQVIYRRLLTRGLL